MKAFVAPALAVLSVLFFGAGLVVGIGIMIAPAGKFVELAVMLGLLAIWTGTLLSCLCNALYLWLGERPGWLKAVTVLQGGGAVLSVAIFWARGGAGGLLS